MVEEGLVEEARRVYPLRYLNSLNTVGYKEMFAYFDGTMDFPTAVARLQKNTRVYAKKRTLRGMPRTPACIGLPRPTTTLYAVLFPIRRSEFSGIAWKKVANSHIKQ